MGDRRHRSRGVGGLDLGGTRCPLQMLVTASEAGTGGTAAQEDGDTAVSGAEPPAPARSPPGPLPRVLPGGAHGSGSLACGAVGPTADISLLILRHLGPIKVCMSFQISWKLPF